MKNSFSENFWLERQTSINPNKLFIKTSLQEFTFSQVFELSKKTAEYFHQKGINKGSHVTVISENNFEFIIVINALWFLGTLPILINSRFKKNEIEKLLIHSDSKFLIGINSKIDFSNSDLNSVIDFSVDKIKDANSINVLEKFDIENTAAMIYSSGSTGEPKLVELTFNNFYNSFLSSNNFTKHTQKDIWLASLPFYHVGGFSIITRSLLAGCAISIPNSLKENDLLEAFDKFQPSLISLVPTMLQKIIDRKIKPWKNLRIVFLGGGPASEKIIKESLENKIPIALVYGSTETTSMVTFCSSENLLKNGISAGQTFPSVNLKIVDEKGNELKSNQIGEIVIQSNSVAKSYYKNDKLKNLGNGIYFTKDLGKLDNNGNLQVYGRKDDIIISGGENISLNEIEKLIVEKFKNYNAAAIGIKDEKWGQSYILVIESENDEKLKIEIQEYLKLNLASYKLPQKIFFKEEFPRTDLGKVKKRDLAEQLKINAL